MLITAETARSMARKSWEARREREASEAINPLPAIAKPQIDPDLAKRLARVRRQLTMLDTRLEEELSKDGHLEADKPTPQCDGQLVNWLCAAQERLAEQERKLAGRPLPGSLRPSSKPTRSVGVPRAEPIDLPADPPSTPGPYLGPENG